MEFSRTSSSFSTGTENSFSRTNSASQLLPVAAPVKVPEAVVVVPDLCLEKLESDFPKDDIRISVAGLPENCVPANKTGEVEGQDEKSGDCSNGRAAFNVIMTAFGIGITMLPKVMASGGWFGGISLLLITNLYGVFCTRRLYDVLLNNASGRQVMSFEELGEVTFGRVGKLSFRALLCVVLFSMAMYMVDLQANAGYYLSGEHLTKPAWRWIANIPMIILAWIPSLKEVGIVSCGGILATLGLMAIIATSSAAYMKSPLWSEHTLMVPGLDEHTYEEAPLQYSLGPRELLPFCSAVCQAMLAFSVTPTTPTIVHSMKTPQDFPRVLNRSAAVIIFVYLVVACVSYAAFGDNVSDNVITSITLASESVLVLKILHTAMEVIVVVLCASNFLVLLTPLASTAEQLLSSLNVISSAETDKEAPTDDKPRWTHAVLRAAGRSGVVLAAICATIAVQTGADRINAFVTLVAGLAVMPITVIIPIFCYWRTLQQMQRRHPNRLVLACEVLLVLLCVGCAGVMMVDFVHKVRNLH